MDTVRTALHCIECLVTGEGKRRAEFVVNGQSVCEKHVRVAVRHRGQTERAYTFSAPDGQPVLEPVLAP